MRSSMRSCIDRYSMDSQYQQSMDGDRVASTFDFMRGGDEDEEEAYTAERGRFGGDRQEYGSFLGKGRENFGTFSRNRRQSSLLSSERGSERNISVGAVKVPRSPAGSFISGSNKNSKYGSDRGIPSDCEHGARNMARVSPQRSPQHSPRSRQVRRMDSTLSHDKSRSSPVSVSPEGRRLADKHEVVYGNAEEASSGRLGVSGSQRQLNAVHASPKPKTVSFRPEKPVVIEPSLRERRAVAPVPQGNRGNRRLVSALRSMPKPPTSAEIAAKRVREAERREKERQRPRGAPSPGSSFGSLQQLGRQVAVSTNSSFNSLPRSVNASPRSRSKRFSGRIAPEELSRRR